MSEIKWILCSQELPKEDGWYAISYDGETWRHGIWMNRNNSFNESHGGWTLQIPVWWAKITPPNKACSGLAPNAARQVGLTPLK